MGCEGNMKEKFLYPSLRRPIHASVRLIPLVEKVRSCSNLDAEFYHMHRGFTYNSHYLSVSFLG